MSSDAKRSILSAFASLGHPPLPPPVLSRVAALSESTGYTPAQLAEAWDAHSLSRGVDVLDSDTFGGYRSSLPRQKAAPGARGANTAVLKNAGGLGKRTSPGGAVTPTPHGKRVTVKTEANTTRSIPRINNAGRGGVSAVDNLTTPGGNARNNGSSPRDSKQVSFEATNDDAKGKSVTPPKTPRFSERSNAGQVVARYNPGDLPSASEVSSRADGAGKAGAGCTVSVHGKASHPTAEFRHMFAPLERRSAALEERLNGLGEAMREGLGVRTEEEEMLEMDLGGEDGGGRDGAERGGKEKDGFVGTWTPVGVPKQNTVVCVGRICNEAHEGRLNSKSIRLEGSRRDSSGSRISVDLQSYVAPVPVDGAEAKGDDEETARKRDYSFFPGQIVAVEGINSSGRTIRPSRVAEGLAPPADTIPAAELLRMNHAPTGEGGRDGLPLSIVSVAGPYTARDNLDYEPFMDVVLKISEERPDVVILTGPFVDRRHPNVASGTPTITEEDGTVRLCSYEQLFVAQISNLIEDLYMNDPTIRTQFVLVPSTEDAFLDGVYPQPPLQDRVADMPKSVPKELREEFNTLGLEFIESAGLDSVSPEERELIKSRGPRVHCVSNPATLKINEVTVGVTSSDVLFHISSDECNANLDPGTRLTRIASHLVNQRSYYPLFPAAKGACLDLSRESEWAMPVRPDVLIVPSKLACFARKVSGSTVVVNPGELTKGCSGGTYATIDVHPAKREELEDAAGRGEEVECGVQDRVRVDIRRI